MQQYPPVQNTPYQQPYGNPYAQPSRAAQPVQQLSHSQYYVQPSPYGETPSVPSIDIGGFSLPMPVLMVATALLILEISMLLQAAWLMWINVLIAGGIAFCLWKAPYRDEVKGHLIIAVALAVLSLVIVIVAMVSGNRPDTASQPMQGYNYSQPAQETQGRSNFPTLTSAPTAVPTSVPTQKPTAAPTWTPVPTRAPTPTPRPTATPAEVTHDGIALGMQLYYNIDGGSYYHTTPNCTAINAKYLPLKGKITYSQLTESKFKRLKPCNSCSAPVRPHSH